MGKLLSPTVMFLVVLPVFAQNNEANINAAVEDRYKEWLAAANKKDAVALTNLYDEDAVLMPKGGGARASSKDRRMILCL